MLTSLGLYRIVFKDIMTTISSLYLLSRTDQLNECYLLADKDKEAHDLFGKWSKFAERNLNSFHLRFPCDTK